MRMILSCVVNRVKVSPCLRWNPHPRSQIIIQRGNASVEQPLGLRSIRLCVLADGFTQVGLSFLPDSRRIPKWRKAHRVAPAMPARRTSRHRTKTLTTSVNMPLRGQRCFDSGGTQMDPITTHLEIKNFLFPQKDKE